MTYEAIVARVHTRKHPNADRVQLGDVMGYQVVVGLDTEDGELGVFFPVDGQLSHEFCMANKLYMKHPDTGEPMGGHFDHKRRVRAQRFRGEISEGIWCPLSYFPTGYGDLPATAREGARFTELDGIEICRKYETPATKRAQLLVPKTSRRREYANFPKHYDTPQLRENIRNVHPDSLVIVTEKLHGTSARTGYVMVPAPRWYHRAWNWIAARTGLPTIDPPDDLVALSGTRNCLLEPGADGEKGMAYRQEWHDTIAPKLMPGEVVYYEIVGPGIMGMHSTDGLDKADRKACDKITGGMRTIDYGYGGHAAYVYRITRAGEDLTWYEMEVRAEELGLPVVPVLEFFKGHEVTLELCNELTRGASRLSRTIPREGICLREEWTDDAGTVHVSKALKHKSYLFCALEGIRKNDETYVDSEEAA